MRGAAGLRPTRPVVTHRARPRAAPRPGFDLDAMRRAAALYLLGREAVARDVAVLLLPGPDERPATAGPRGSDTARTGAPAAAVRPGAADLAVWARGRCLLVGFAPPKGRPRPGQDRFAAALRALGHDYRMLHPETPAHAVELLAKLLDGVEDR